MIKSKQLARALFELAEDKTAGLENKFLDFVKSRNLASQMPSVLYHLEKIMEREQEKKGIEIEVAHEIKPAIAHHIKTFLNADNLPETVKIKKELVGGFRAKWGGVIYDASILSGLQKLQKAISGEI
ncbi:MAG TPA: F0F1 ATP synthase subunit delta [Candidatus Paceibacterota bacterium]